MTTAAVVDSDAQRVHDHVLAEPAGAGGRIRDRHRDEPGADSDVDSGFELQQRSRG